MTITRTFSVFSALIYTVILCPQPQALRAQTIVPVTVNSIQCRTVGDATRVVVEMDGRAGYKGERLNNPDRIFFDLSAAKLGADLAKQALTVKDERVKRVRAAQNRPGVVRVVFDVSDVSEYSVQELRNPYRMVIELHGQPETAADAGVPAPGSVMQITDKNKDTGKQEMDRPADRPRSKALPGSEVNASVNSVQAVDIKEQNLSPAPGAEAHSAVAQNGPASIRGIQYQPMRDATRVVIEMDGRAAYKGERLKNPDRIFFDISGAKLGVDLAKQALTVKDERVKRIRAAQNRPGVVRVVFDVSDVSEYSVQELRNPYRMVVDFHGKAWTGSDPAIPASDSVREGIVAKEDPAKKPEVGQDTEVSAEPDAKPAPDSALTAETKEQDIDPVATPDVDSADAHNGPASIRGIQYQPMRDATRVVIEMDGRAEYRGERLSNPDRIFFDISGAKLGAHLAKQALTVKDERIKRVRAAQNRPGVVRVVFDVSDVGKYSVQELRNPCRMVVDFHGKAWTGSDPAIPGSDSVRESIVTKEDQPKKPEVGQDAEVSAEPEAKPAPDSALTAETKEQDIDPVATPEEDSPDAHNGPASIRSIQYQPMRDATRVVIEMNGRAAYRGERLSSPDRIFFDLSAAKLGAGFANRTLAVDDKRLRRIRAAQNRPEVVRVVLDVSDVGKYSVRELQDPYRMVVDLHGKAWAGSDPVLSEFDSSRESIEATEDTGKMTKEEQANRSDAEVAAELRPEPGAGSGQVDDFKEDAQSPLASGSDLSSPGRTDLAASSSPLKVGASQLDAVPRVVNQMPKPTPRSNIQPSGFSPLQGRPFTITGVLTTGYYSAYTRGGSNESQSIGFAPASATFDVNGFFLSPDVLDYSFQPELNASPQASDAGFQGGNGIRMRITSFRKQAVPVTFRYSNVSLENVYFGSLSQLSSYTLNNRTRELGLTTQLKYPGLPTATVDWGTSSVLSQSFIPEIPDYVSRSDHKNVDVVYQRGGWDFRAFAGRQRQTSNLFVPAGDSTDASTLQQKLKQYRGSARWSFLKDSEMYVDTGSQTTSNLLLSQPIDLTSRYVNVNLRVFQRRRWKTSLRAGYTSNISNLLMNNLIGDLTGSGSIAPDAGILEPLQRTTSSLNFGGFTSVDLSHGLSLFGSADKAAVSPTGNRELGSRYFTTTGGISYSKAFGWGNLSGQYGRSYGNGSVTGNSGRILGQNYVVTVQPGKWDAFQLDFSVRGTEQKIVNALPAFNDSFAFDGNVGFRLFGGLRARLGGGWQKSGLTNADSSFESRGYTARAALEHSRFQLSGSLNSQLGNTLQAYDQMYSGIGAGSALLSPFQVTPSDLRGLTLSLYALPVRRLELSALYTRSIQHLEGIVGNDFETVDLSAKFHFRNLKLEAGFFRSGQIYTNNSVTYPETERGRFYIRISRSVKF